MWLEQFEGTWLIIHEDNTSVVNKLKNFSMREPALNSLWNAIMILALWDIVIKSHWLLFKENTLADILSQGQWAKLANNYKHLQKVFPNYPLQWSAILQQAGMKKFLSQV